MSEQAPTLNDRQALALAKLIAVEKFESEHQYEGIELRRMGFIEWDESCMTYRTTVQGRKAFLKHAALDGDPAEGDRPRW